MRKSIESQIQTNCSQFWCTLFFTLKFNYWNITLSNKRWNIFILIWIVIFTIIWENVIYWANWAFWLWIWRPLFNSSKIWMELLYVKASLRWKDFEPFSLKSRGNIKKSLWCLWEFAIFIKERIFFVEKKLNLRYMLKRRIVCNLLKQWCERFPFVEPTFYLFECVFRLIVCC